MQNVKEKQWREKSTYIKKRNYADHTQKQIAQLFSATERQGNCLSLFYLSFPFLVFFSAQESKAEHAWTGALHLPFHSVTSTV